jgi:hypothetical protein
MIYILINNQYHVYDFNQWIDDFNGQEISLIQVPHSLNPLKCDGRFFRIYTYPKFFQSSFSLLRLYKIFNLHKKIRKEILPEENDILLVYTEYEILNQFIVNLFYKSNARVFLLEDGLATMTLCNSNFFSRKLKSKFFEFVLKNIYSYKYLRIYDLPDPTPLMEDKFFSGVCVKLGNSIKREIPLFNISNCKSLVIEDLNFERAIFINNDLYNYLCNIVF